MAEALPPHLDPGPLGRSIYSIGDQLRFPAQGASPELPQKLQEKVREALDYTRLNRNDPLGRFNWSIPVYSIFHWSLIYGRPGYEQSENDVRALFASLQEAPDFNKEIAVNTLGIIMAGFVQHWDQSGYFPQALGLLDQIEAWAITEPAYPREWIHQTGMLQTRAVLRQHLVPPQQRASMLSGRHRRLASILDNPDINLSYRTRILTQWANALYLTGDGQNAQHLMSQWWQRRDRSITDPLFFAVWMKIICYERLDIQTAGLLLEHVNALPSEKLTPADQQTIQNSAIYYYNALQLPDYEIRRLRHAEIQQFIENHEVIRQQFERMQARKENR